ncbi:MULTISPECIES: flagellar type III secretion system pore protein FliP [unclassified Duganella]|uniref:flagellar type III secretion system pore protein FliP n=1 Tax=unclassified Duganella TaxID=2636909 RepID=UPI0006FF2DD6|nr:MULTISPECIES: flagellar type III secretion system pore protein FliP [unclassified Duganella]KQV58002.1 flagellar biosynthesis protein flip [Duganella sp. Root336D2]KRB99147.1 flagellar biosynthesis protein flip [Duganella sp. Root198D2]
MKRPHFLLLALACLALPAVAAEPSLALPGVQVQLGKGGTDAAAAVRILLGLTVLSLAPAILMSMTSFIRIAVVLSMLRTALGMQDTPPNTVLISLALFLTYFTMAPTLKQVNEQALQPYMAGKLSTESAFDKGSAPLRDFMVRQTREQDLALMVELAKAAPPQDVSDISMSQLVPAFMLSELRAAFQIGFVVFLPFLLVDLIVSSALMALGMMMVPPASIALPLKILLFVLMDGWNLVVRSLLGTFA